MEIAAMGRSSIPSALIGCLLPVAVTSDQWCRRFSIRIRRHQPK
jgi:hypothetical protein